MILLARHGQTEWNVSHRRQGRLDSPLTAQGIEHAHQVARAAAAYPVDAIASSPLGRARRTAEIVSQALGLGVVVIDDLAEIDHGSFTTLTTEEIDRLHPGWSVEREADLYHWRFPGGESYEDARERAERVLAHPVVTEHSCPLLVGHQMIGRMFMAILERLTPDEALARNLPHGTVVAFPD